MVFLPSNIFTRLSLQASFAQRRSDAQPAIVVFSRNNSQYLMAFLKAPNKLLKALFDFFILILLFIYTQKKPYSKSKYITPIYDQQNSKKKSIQPYKTKALLFFLGVVFESLAL